MKRNLLARLGILCILAGCCELRAAAESIPTILLPAAIVNRPYNYQISVTGLNGESVRFAEVDDGNSKWLHVSGSGLLEGTPDGTASAQSTITIRAHEDNGSEMTAVFVVPVEKVDCPPTDKGALAWCGPSPNSASTEVLLEEDLTQRLASQWNFHRTDKPAGGGLDRNLETIDIIQFSRVAHDRGRFSHLKNNEIKWIGEPSEVAPELVNAINGSKVPISGSILVDHGVSQCSRLDWKVVTETLDSSNILVYGPSDVSVFCHGDTLIIVLPVHAIWANVFAYLSKVTDPSWKPSGDVPPAHDCKGYPAAVPPPQGIRPCDSIRGPKSGWNPILGAYYWSPIASTYNRLTQPGVSQGSLSIAPFDLAAKGTWDAQAYLSSRVGPGWLGIAGMLEHDIKAQDDLNSLTAAVSYDWRFKDSRNFWASTQEPQLGSAILGARVPEFNVRFGPEAEPGFPDVTHAQRDLNLVGGATVRFPIVLSFLRQPSIMSILPVAGFEGGKRINSHEIDGADQPPYIARFLGGVDASLRWPFQVTHNFLGDKPITLDYSYRIRQLFYAEPYVNAALKSPSEASQTGTRGYNRITLIMPLSAYFQLRAAWQHGTLPPEFQYVGNLFTLGVTFSNPGSVEH